MKKTQTIIERLSLYLEYKKIPPTRFEKEAGLSNGSITKRLKDKGSLNETTINKILDYCPDLNPLWLFIGGGEMLKNGKVNGKANGKVSGETGIIENNNNVDIQLFNTEFIESVQHNAIPIYNLPATIGLNSFLNNTSTLQPVNYLYLPDLNGCDGAITFFGDTMYPLVKAGDVIVYKAVNKNIKNLFWGEIYLIGFTNETDELVTLKHIQQSVKDGFVKLVSFNKNYSDIEIPFNNITALALIKATIRYNVIQ